MTYVLKEFYIKGYIQTKPLDDNLLSLLDEGHLKTQIRYLVVMGFINLTRFLNGVEGADITKRGCEIIKYL